MEFNFLRIIKLNCFSNRSICTSYALNAKQIGNAMKKVMGTSKKKKFFEEPPLPTASSFSKGSFEGKHSGNSRRATVLNKLFMKHITDLMATGNHAQEILGHGIEVNRVKVSPDYQFLNVYWIAKGTNSDEVIDNILKSNAGFLRNELSQLRVMGEVPLINFIKDKNFAQISEVKNRLAVADFGEDHVRNDSFEKLKTELELYMQLDLHVKKMVKTLEMENKKADDIDQECFPQMPQNVLGLNHADISNRITKALNKSTAAHRKADESNNTEETWEQFKINQPINIYPVSFDSGKEQREAFKNFLQKRQLLKLKKRREDKNYSPDLELLKEELRERQMYINFDSFDYLEDYIIEDFEDK